MAGLGTLMNGAGEGSGQHSFVSQSRPHPDATRIRGGGRTYRSHAFPQSKDPTHCSSSSSPSPRTTAHAFFSPSPHASRFSTFPHQHRAASVTAHGGHAPGWHGSAQAWFPHASRFSHARPQERSARAASAVEDGGAETGDVREHRKETVCLPQWHGRCVVTWQGGHGPGWHASAQGCPHARGREQGLAQEWGVERRGGFGSWVEPQKHLPGAGQGYR